MSFKRQQTMAKMARERSVKERRERKAEKKRERKLAAAEAASGEQSVVGDDVEGALDVEVDADGVVIEAPVDDRELELPATG